MTDIKSGSHTIDRSLLVTSNKKPIPRIGDLISDPWKCTFWCVVTICVTHIICTIITNNQNRYTSVGSYTILDSHTGRCAHISDAQPIFK